VSDLVTERLYFRQLLAGRDFAEDDFIARQMVNFVYLIGDRETGEAVAVDPAYGVRELVELAGADGMRITGALVTHYHPDHVGGDLMGYPIEGVRELLAIDDLSAPLHVQRP
jgi:glyoxylase-like metal-dependent hydrolase (beta-lactamase superfamily II)